MKKITSLTLAFSFLIMSYTGIMLYFVPKGRVAYWADWHLFGLSKSQYGELHTTSMLTMLFFCNTTYILQLETSNELHERCNKKDIFYEKIATYSLWSESDFCCRYALYDSAI